MAGRETRVESRKHTFHLGILFGSRRWSLDTGPHRATEIEKGDNPARLPRDIALIERS